MLANISTVMTCTCGCCSQSPGPSLPQPQGFGYEANQLVCILFLHHNYITLLTYLTQQIEEYDNGDGSDSDDEYFDAIGESSSIPEENSSLISPSISICTMEGDPPEVEEDKDFFEKDDIEGTYVHM